MTTEIRFPSAITIMQRFIDKDEVLMKDYFIYEERNKMEAVARAFANTTRKSDEIRSGVKAALNSRWTVFETRENKKFEERLCNVLEQIGLAQKAKL